MSIVQKIIGSGLLFLLTIGAGVWLSYSGKPYNTLFFTIHKLIALVAVIFTAILIFNLFKNMEIKSFLISLIIVAGLSIVALFISGAFLSIGNVPYVLVKTIHIIAIFLALASTITVLYLLISRK